MLAQSKLVPGVKKIVVLRANALGDLLVSLPALEALKAAYPDAEISLLSKAWPVAFLKGRPGPIDRIIPIPPYPGVGESPETAGDLAEQAAFFKAMQAEQFDLAIQLHGGGGYSNPFVKRLGARLTLGLKAKEAMPLDRWIPYEVYQPEIFRFLEVVSLVGALPTPQLEPHLAVTQADLDEAKLVVGGTSGSLVVLHPGATDPRRRWPPEKFAAVGDALVHQADAVLAVTGSDWEKDQVEAVIARMKAPALNLTGRLSLNGLTGLLSDCALLISNDSGPRHLAAAVGTATVGIFWCGNLINFGPLTRRRHRPLISWQLACPECGLDCTQTRCEHRSSFVAQISTEEVIKAALDLLHPTHPKN